jgi:hypothetical protein
MVTHTHNFLPFTKKTSVVVKSTMNSLYLSISPPPPPPHTIPFSFFLSCFVVIYPCLCNPRQDDQPHGVGIVHKKSGGKFEGHFVKGQRTGGGAETWGNVLNLKYLCPMGHHHAGRGFCRYEGKYLNGFFHGSGYFKCIDGRAYHGMCL